MNKQQRQVLEFLERLNIPFPNRELNFRRPSLRGVDHARVKLVRELIQEESCELVSALSKLEMLLFVFYCRPELGRTLEGIIRKIMSEVIDGMCDTIVTIHNATNAFSIDLDPFFEEVHKTNLKKVGGPIALNGKILKPEGWEPPRIREILDEMLDEEDIL